MPELPEVETVVRGLRPSLEGARIDAVTLARPDLRFPFPPNFAAVLNGTTVTALSRRAKYVLADLENGYVLVAHLGMSGSFRVEEPSHGSATPGEFHHPRSKDTSHDHVRMRLSNGFELVYNDPRRFGYMTVIERSNLATDKLFADMGVEPLGNALSPDYLATRFAGRRTPLKAALLDQRTIAGLGNIYVCEALWRSGLSPRRLAGTLARKNGAATRRAERLVDSIKDVLGDAIEAGGSSLRDYVHADGSLGYFQHRFAVYDREALACLRPGCSGVILRIVQSNRSTFYCPTCQR